MIQRKEWKVIATHVNGKGNGNTNKASAIGKFGNDYDAMQRFFNELIIAHYGGISLNGINIPVAAPAPQQQPLLPMYSYKSNEIDPVSYTNKSLSNKFDAERWLNSVKNIAGAGEKDFLIASPLLGPLGKPVSAIAGATLNNMTNVLDVADVRKRSATNGSGGGSIKRAVLAERTLQAVLKMKDSATKRRILADMRRTYRMLAPNLKPLVCQLISGLVDQDNAEAGAANDLHAAKLVARRAVMGEAALQAALQASMQLERSKLRQPKELSSGKNGAGGGDLPQKEERFMNFVKTAAQNIGLTVEQMASDVITTVLPV